eukprot:170961-Prorocentrum_minimum.AAC.1
MTRLTCAACLLVGARGRLGHGGGHCLECERGPLFRILEVPVEHGHGRAPRHFAELAHVTGRGRGRFLSPAGGLRRRGRQCAPGGNGGARATPGFGCKAGECDARPVTATTSERQRQRALRKLRKCMHFGPIQSARSLQCAMLLYSRHALCSVARIEILLIASKARRFQVRGNGKDENQDGLVDENVYAEGHTGAVELPCLIHGLTTTATDINSFNFTLANASMVTFFLTPGDPLEQCRIPYTSGSKAGAVQVLDTFAGSIRVDGQPKLMGSVNHNGGGVTVPLRAGVITVEVSSQWTYETAHQCPGR